MGTSPGTQRQSVSVRLLRLTGRGTCGTAYGGPHRTGNQGPRDRACRGLLLDRRPARSDDERDASQNDCRREAFHG